tara:strand:+ start:1583 stop:2707 length:1125 start_codon:yes stop_codon:yes gene_type:complete
MTQEIFARISAAIGVQSVFLAARLDEKLVGRFSHMEGKFLLDRDGSQATRRALADVMVYMAAQYGKTLSLEQVELGLLVASKEYGELDNQDVDSVPEPQSEVEPTSFLKEEPDEDVVVSMESSDSEEDFFTEEFTPEEKPKEQRKGRPGVKPDDTMLESMLNGDDRLTEDDVGISTLDVAKRYYDWVGNDLAMAESEESLNHKVKLSIGATMKALGWKKRMRKGQWGWHPTSDFTFGTTSAPLIDPEDVLLRKRHEMVADTDEEEIPVEIASTLPRLSEKDIDDEIDDDIPWPDMSEGFTDGAEPEPESSRSFVKIVDESNGTEDVEEFDVFSDKTMTFVMIDGQKRMLEWDNDEEIFALYVSNVDQVISAISK